MQLPFSRSIRNEFRREIWRGTGQPIGLGFAVRFSQHELDGLFDPGSLMIWLRSGLTCEVASWVLEHEILHARIFFARRAGMIFQRWERAALDAFDASQNGRSELDFYRKHSPDLVGEEALVRLVQRVISGENFGQDFDEICSVLTRPPPRLDRLRPRIFLPIIGWTRRSEIVNLANRHILSMSISEVT